MFSAAQNALNSGSRCSSRPALRCRACSGRPSSRRRSSFLEVLADQSGSARSVRCCRSPRSCRWPGRRGHTGYAAEGRHTGSARATIALPANTFSAMHASMNPSGAITVHLATAHVGFVDHAAHAAEMIAMRMRVDDHRRHGPLAEFLVDEVERRPRGFLARSAHRRRSSPYRP